MNYLIKRILTALLGCLSQLPFKQLLSSWYEAELFPRIQKRVLDDSQFDFLAMVVIDKIARELLDLPPVKLEHPTHPIDPKTDPKANEKISTPTHGPV